MTKRDLCTAALQELGVLDPEDTASDADMNMASGAFDRLYDSWNAQRQAVYADVFAEFTLTALLSPQIIGPTGNMVVTQRPVSIEAAGLMLTTGSVDVRRTITVRDAAWWARQQVKTLPTDVPTDLYYGLAEREGVLPAGSASAVVVELQNRMPLAALTLNDTFTMPPGTTTRSFHAGGNSATVCETGESGLEDGRSGRARGGLCQQPRDPEHRHGGLRHAARPRWARTFLQLDGPIPMRKLLACLAVLLLLGQPIAAQEPRIDTGAITAVSSGGACSAAPAEGAVFARCQRGRCPASRCRSADIHGDVAV
jgi:hypothetical protein